ncbi:MAG TPA: quinoprotein relay system zinc metallohydrolase 2 [Rhodocyclaceae bacterium]|nr:quinoprotein relay system zinc metallohydrolase 2 [Rhodocyclaceae bacterium]
MFRSLTERRGGALICALPAWVCLLGAAPAAAAGIAPLAVVEAAAGVFVHLGRHEETTSANRGDIANIGFIVGERCVAVVDSGGSLAVGLALKAAVRAKTNRPVCYVINTHMHPDHVFGNAAFVDAADASDPSEPVRFVGSARLPDALATRDAHYRAALRAALGEGAAGSRVVPPDLLVEGELHLDLGGRVLILRTWPTAHTNNDLTVFDAATGTLWLGDLLFERRIPSLDGSIKGWLAVIGQLRELPARQVIPGHGALGLAWPAALDATARYLEQVAGQVKAALDRGLALHETVNAANLAAETEAAGWLLAESYHRRNVTAAYAELEWE